MGKDSTKHLLIIVLLTVNIFNLGFGQEISGVVRESSSLLGVAGATVFINNSSASTTTDSNGKFTLKINAEGYLTIGVHQVGYQLFRAPLKVEKGKSYILNLQVIKNDNGQENVLLSPNEGLTKIRTSLHVNNDSQIRIRNESELKFFTKQNSLELSADTPMIVENVHLGYLIYLYPLSRTTLDGDLLSDCLVAFQNLNTVELSNEFYRKNQLESYHGSLMHFLRSIAKGSVSSSGFEVLDSLSKPIKISASKSDKISDHFQLNGNSKFKIIYEAGQPEKMVSELWLSDNLLFSKDGVIFNKDIIVVTGAMNKSGIASALPLDFDPQETSDSLAWLLPLQEKVYLKTDKGYYYPGEDLWFCAIMDYRLPNIKDSLSHTLYVDLIGPDLKILEKKVLRIEEGLSANDFKLGSDLPPGLYFLRAYTNWMRNYGDVSHSSIPVPILGVDKNIKNQEPQKDYNSEMVDVKVTFNKKVYSARDKVDVQISLSDINGNPVKGKCVVTATDDESVRSLRSRVFINDIIGQWDQPELEDKDTALSFLERGLAYSGFVEDKRGRFPAHLDMIVSQGLDLVSIDTDDLGKFYLNNLEFYDSLNLFIKAVDKKGRPLSDITIDTRPSVQFTDSSEKMNLELTDFNAAQRIQNTYRPDRDVTLLEEVEIVGKKVNQEEKWQDPMKKLYGRADYTVDGEDLISIAGSNVLIGLQGRVPGVMVRENSQGGVQINLRGLSLQGNTTPMILVDGIPFEANDLRSISASQIDHIEIVKRALAQFGSRGGNGLIAIYTKMSSHSEYDRTITPDYVLKKLGGYSLSRNFYSPDYSEIKSPDYDFRSTLYWNPYVSTDDKGIATIHFYASDLVGNYTIEVEGVTEKEWKPFHATLKFSVDE